MHIHSPRFNEHPERSNAFVSLQEGKAFHRSGHIDVGLDRRPEDMTALMFATLLGCPTFPRLRCLLGALT